MSMNMFAEKNLSHELLSTTRKRKTNAFENNMSIDINLSKTQILKITQSGGVLSSLWPKIAGPLMKPALALVKNTLVPFGISATSSASDAGIQNKVHGFETTTLIVSNKEINDMMKIVQFLEDSNISLKRITKTIENETEEQKRNF